MQPLAVVAMKKWGFVMNVLLYAAKHTESGDRLKQSIETVEYPDGFSDGVVISTDEVQLIFRDQVNTSAIAMDTFRRAT